MFIFIEKPKNYFNNGYESFSPVQEEKLARMGLPESVIKTLDKSLWATLSGEYVSKHLTVYEAAELAVYADKCKTLPLIGILKKALVTELGIKC